MKHGTKFEPAWKDKAPGLERAACVLRPATTGAPLVYALFWKRTKRPLLGLIGMAEAALAVRYKDGERKHRLVPDVTGRLTRLISAHRVEQAVEDAEFMAICDDESLEVVRVGGKFRVRRPTSARAWWGPEAQSVRGAYVAYHAMPHRGRGKKAERTRAEETPEQSAGKDEAAA